MVCGGREAERLAALLERAETFAAQQASRHEEVMGAVHIEKAALQREFEAKLKVRAARPALEPAPLRVAHGACAACWVS